MNDQTDQQLLRDYATHRSEAAFAELVRRHVDLVHSAAHRMLGDPHLARDITQATFVALAQHAAQLTDRPALSGWLHTTARNLAVKTIRTDARRRVREQEAVAMNELLSSAPDVPWEQIAPHLDAAIGELTEPERDAVLLRYFDKKSAAEIGSTLGISAEAAQKRVSRAVERLREFFVKRGVTVGAGGLVVVISANAVQAAPVGLAVTISAATTAAITTIATHTTMHWLNLKSIAAIVAAAVTAGTGTHLLQQRETNRLRSENQTLVAQQTQLTSERDTMRSAIALRNEEAEASKKEKLELLRLRGEVAMLRKQVAEAANLKTENLRLRAASASRQNSQPVQSSGATQPKFSKETWAFAGYATPEAAMHTWIWAMNKGDKDVMLKSLTPQAQAQWKPMLEGQSLEQSPFVAYSFVATENISDEEATVTVVSDLPNGKKTGEQKMSLKKIGSDWRIAGQAKE